MIEESTLSLTVQLEQNTNGSINRSILILRLKVSK